MLLLGGLGIGFAFLVFLGIYTFFVIVPTLLLGTWLLSVLIKNDTWYKITVALLLLLALITAPLVVIEYMDRTAPPEYGY